MKYELINSIDGYVATDTAAGIDITDDNGNFICELNGMGLSFFKNENGDIDEERLKDAIRNQIDVEEFLDSQGAIY